MTVLFLDTLLFSAFHMLQRAIPTRSKFFIAIEFCSGLFCNLIDNASLYLGRKTIHHWTVMFQILLRILISYILTDDLDVIS